MTQAAATVSVIARRARDEAISKRSSVHVRHEIAAARCASR
jgi:hypothetical protein